MEILDEIRAAWPVTPYPGDHILSDCWCEECEFSFRNLRGKSWNQLAIEDFNCEGDRMGHEAFNYYLPAALSLSVQTPDEYSLPADINAHFVFHDHELEDSDRQQRIAIYVELLTQHQRKVLLAYFDWLSDQNWQAPVLISAARRAIGDSVVQPYSFDELGRWCRQRERELKSEI